MKKGIVRSSASSAICVAALAVSSAGYGATVAQVKALADGGSFTNLTGIVTSVGGGTGRLGFTLQDNTGGILVDKGATTYVQPNLGDSVTILNGTSVHFSSGAVHNDPEGRYTVEAVPVANTDVVVNSNNNALPTPLDFANLTAYMTADFLDTQGRLVRLHNLHLIYSNLTTSGTTTWTNGPAVAGLNFNVSDGTTQTVLRLTSDINGTGGTWSTKTRPSDTNPTDTFDVVAASAWFAVAATGVPSPGNEISLNNWCGTTAKTDATTGPIRAATSNVDLWRKY